MTFSAFDYPIQAFLTQFANRSYLLDHAINAISSYDLFKGVILFSLFWFAWFFERSGDTADSLSQRRSRLLIVFGGTLLTVGIARVLQKLLSIHQRPLHADLGLSFPSVVDVGKLSTWNSFPSDHAAYFFAFATGLWGINKGLSLFAFLWTAVMVCFPRVYLGIHYPSDIVAGAALGIGLMLILLRIKWFEKPAAYVLDLSKKYPGLFYWLAFLLIVNAAHLFDDLRDIVEDTVEYVKMVR